MREKRLITFVAFVLAVSSYEGEMLSLVKVTRSEMGAYLCIAANGVPPSVSKRMMVHIHCEF
jgi:neurotrimin